MGGLIAGFLGWIVSKIFGSSKQADMEKELAKKSKENVELKAEIAGETLSSELKEQREQEANEWKSAKNDEKWDKVTNSPDKS